MNTPDKRRSSVKLLSIPDNNIDIGDRRQIVGLYRFTEAVSYLWKIISIPRTSIGKILGVNNENVSKVMGV